MARIGKGSGDDDGAKPPQSSVLSPQSFVMIRVLLAEDQAMIRGALAALLALEADIEVVAEVARGDERFWTSKCPVAMGSPPPPRCTSNCPPAAC